eukprot:g29846.t1
MRYSSSFRVTLEEAQDGHVAQGEGGGVEMVHDRTVLSFVTNRAQVLYKVVSKPLLGFTDVEEATSGASVAAEEGLFHISYEEAGIAWAHAGSRGHLLSLELEVLEEVEGVVGIPDVGGEFLDQEGENRVK